LKDIDAVTTEWRNSDTQHLKTYTSSMGRVGGGASTTTSEPLQSSGESVVESVSVEGKEAVDEASDPDWAHDVLVVGGIIINVFKRNGQ
jgi:hypothetical protein